MNGKLRWIPVYNGSGETIPARAAMEPLTINARGQLVVTKPNKDDSNSALINGDSSIPAGGYGFGTYGWPCIALYNDGDPPAANQQSIGTRAGYWQLHTGYEGFLVWGSKSSSNYVVQRDLTCREIGGPHGYYYGPDGIDICLCCGCARFGALSTTLLPNPLYATVTTAAGTRVVTCNWVGVGRCFDPQSPSQEGVRLWWSGTLNAVDLFSYVGHPCNGDADELGFAFFAYNYTVDLYCTVSRGYTGLDELGLPRCSAWTLAVHLTDYDRGVSPAVKLTADLVGQSYSTGLARNLVLLSCTPVIFVATGKIECSNVFPHAEWGDTTVTEMVGTSWRVDINE